MGCPASAPRRTERVRSERSARYARSRTARLGAPSGTVHSEIRPMLDHRRSGPRRHQASSIRASAHTPRLPRLGQKLEDVQRGNVVVHQNDTRLTTTDRPRNGTSTTLLLDVERTGDQQPPIRHPRLCHDVGDGCCWQTLPRVDPPATNVRSKGSRVAARAF